MKRLLANAMRRLGFVPRTDYDRAYAAAQSNRLFADWLTDGLSAQDEARNGLQACRNRARALERDDDHALRYLNLQSKNVIGWSGVRLQAKVRKADGSLDTDTNTIIEEHWQEWGHKETCCVEGTRSWLNAQQMFVRTWKRDGEALVRLVPGFPNPYRFALQFFEADHLDHELNSDPTGKGRTVRNGIEVDSWGRPTAYYLLQKHPGEFIHYHGRRYLRIPAAEIIHHGTEERVNEMRHVTALHTAIAGLRHLGKYREAELIAARAGACKMGFYEEEYTNFNADKKDAAGNAVTEFTPGYIQRLPKGVKFKSHDPSAPNTNSPEFHRSTLSSVAAGLDVGYNKLAQDLEGVNFSSLRAFDVDERDGYMITQEDVAEHFCRAVYRNWLQMLLLTTLTDLPYSRLPEFQRAGHWMPRRWEGIQPLQEAKAREIAVRRGWASDAQIAAHYGNDREEMFRDLKRDEEYEQRHGVSFRGDDDE